MYKIKRRKKIDYPRNPSKITAQSQFLERGIEGWDWDDDA